MRFFVRCDLEGNITSVMKVDAMDDALEHPYGFVEESEVVFETPVPKGAADLDSHEIASLYKADLKTKKLRKQKPQPAKRATKAVKRVSRKTGRKVRT